MQTRRVLLVDEDVRRGETIARILGPIRDVEVVGRAASVHEALASIDQLAPHLLFVRHAPPGLDALTCLDGLKDRPGPPEVVLLCDGPTDSLERRGFPSGARGVLSIADFLRYKFLDYVLG